MGTLAALIHGHVGIPVAVLEQNIHGPLALVYDRDLAQEAAAGEGEAVIIHYC